MLSRPTIFISLPTPTLSPPVQGRFKYVPMSVDGSVGEIVRIDRQSGYQGLYTGGMSYCQAVTIIERNANGEIQNLAMIHYGGGLSSKRFQQLMDETTSRSLEDGGYRELIITGGCDQKNIDSLKQYLALYISDGDNIDAYFRNYLQRNPKLRLSSISYAVSDGEPGSALVTFDGYAGTCYGNAQIFSESRGHDLVIQEENLSQERSEWRKMQRHFSGSKYAIAKIIAAIEGAACDDRVKAQLYFHTREFIYNSEFTQENKEIIKRKYKNKLKEIPLSTKAENIVTAVTCILGIGLITALPYLLFSRYKRGKEIKMAMTECGAKKTQKPTTRTSLISR